MSSHYRLVEKILPGVECSHKFNPMTRKRTGLSQESCPNTVNYLTITSHSQSQKMHSKNSASYCTPTELLTLQRIPSFVLLIFKPSIIDYESIQDYNTVPSTGSANESVTMSECASTRPCIRPIT